MRVENILSTVADVLGTVRDIMSTVGDILSTVGDTRYGGDIMMHVVRSIIKRLDHILSILRITRND